MRWRAGALPTDRQYTGQRWDADLGLYDYRARYYDPALGRFIQPDTVVPKPGDPQSLNRYAYVLNNPLRYNDPSGHKPIPDDDPNFWRDLTRWLVQEANRDATLPEIITIRFCNQIFLVNPRSPLAHQAKTLAYYMFYQIVHDSGPWDFKDKIFEVSRGEGVRLGGHWFEYSTPGNILYGFNGAAAGFTLEELHGGAGIAQLRDHLLEGAPLGPVGTLLDTPDDYYAVEFGYRLYKEAYEPDQTLTLAEFDALLAQYDHLEQMALVEAPPPEPAPREVEGDWPYGPGYFNGDLQPWPAFLFPSFSAR